jgi:drug/metabolite transporter (DMT)-like permease
MRANIESPEGRPAAAAYRLGLLLVLGAGICWSTIGLGVRLIDGATVWQILFYRSIAMALLLFIAIALRSRGRPLGSIRAAGPSGVIGGVAFVAASAGGIVAIQTTTVANAMLLFAMAPFLTAVLGLVVLREGVRRATWIAMAVSLVGVAIMVTAGASRGQWLGNALALLSALGFAVFTITLRWRRSEDTISTAWLGGMFGILVSGAICVVSGLSFILSPADLAIALAMGVFQVGAGLLLYSLGSNAVPAAELALLSMIEVLLGPLWVWLFLGEGASLGTAIGGAILLTALAGNAVSGLRRRPLPISLV